MLRKFILASMLLQLAVTGFAQRSLIITHDDPFVFNQPPQPDTLSTYAVQPDGSLLLIGSFPTGLNGGGGTGDAGPQFIPTRQIAISGDNKFVYASAARTNAVSAFSIDGATGLLTLVPGSPFPTGADACTDMGLAATPNGKTLYAFSGCLIIGRQDAVVTTFAIDANGSLTKVGANFAVDFADDFKVTGDGKFLVLSQLPNQDGTGSETSVLGIAADGSLTPVPGSPFKAQVIPNVFSSALEINCANQVFHGIDAQTSSVEVFNMAANGALTPIGGSPFVAIPAAPTSGGLVGSTLAQNGKVLVVADEFGFAVSFSVGPDGSLTQVGGQLGTPNPKAQPSLGQLTVDSSGKFIYSGAANQAGSGSISIYFVDANAKLSLVTAVPLAIPGFNPFATMASYPVQTCTPAATVVNFGTFNVELKEFTAAPRSFELEGSFTLGATSNGIAPLTEAVTVKAGGYSATIPAGSFKAGLNGSFHFAGTIGGVKIEMSITPSTTVKNKYSFEFEAPVDLTSAGSPVPVSLSIGDDTGSTNVKPEIKATH